MKRVFLSVLLAFSILFADNDLEDFMGKDFYAVNQYATTTKCQDSSDVLYWFFGASEVGGAYLQNEQSQQGIDLFVMIGPRYNFTKMRATPFIEGHSLSVKVGAKYYRTISGNNYDDVFIPMGVEYFYSSDAFFGGGLGVMYNYSALKKENTNISVTASISYLNFFVRGEYVVYAIGNLNTMDRSFEIAIGYKF